MSDAAPPPESDRRTLDAWALAAALGSILLQGHRFGQGNHEIFLPAMRRVLDASHLAGDWVLATPPGHPLTTYPLAWLSVPLGESWTMLLAQLATRFLLFAGLWRFGRALLPELPRFGCLVMMLVVVFEPRMRIGGHYLQGPAWESAHLGMAAALWMSAAGARWVAEPASRAAALRFGALAGLALCAHLFIGLPLAGVVFGAALLARAPLTALASTGGTMLALGAPAWVPAAQGFLADGSAGLSAAETIALLQWRHPHHHMPWTWRVVDWLQFALVFGAVAWMSARLGARALLPRVFLAYYVVAGLVFVACGWWLVAPVVAYFQSFRAAGIVWVLLAALFADAACRAEGWRWIAYLVLAMLGRTAPGLAATLPVTASPRALRADLPDPGARWALAVAGCGAALVVALQTVAPLRNALNELRSDYWRVDHTDRDDAREELNRWFRERTPTDALVVIPPDLPAFRVAARRAVFLDIKHFPYRAADLAEWSRRYRLLTGEASPLARNWEPQGARPLAIPDGPPPEVAADYWVFRRSGELDARWGTLAPEGRWREAFRNRAYLVLEPVTAAAHSSR
ncbi:MAG: DUF6798 domain-containing protein [Candidatus Sumerlaeia bacterium]|nr:DUF6798 domain-containing protein [Candidatus Sumerlaeia bacterium]